MKKCLYLKIIFAFALVIISGCVNHISGVWYTKDNKIVDTKDNNFLFIKYKCLKDAQQPESYSRNNIGTYNNQLYGNSSSGSYVATNQNLYHTCMNMNGFFWIQDKESEFWHGKYLSADG